MNLMKNIWKSKFNSDDYLPLNKTLEIHRMIIVFRAIFYENKKYYPQVYLDECLYKLLIIQKCYITIELNFLKELMLLKQMNQKSVICVTIGIFWKGLSFNRIYAIDTMIY